MSRVLPLQTHPPATPITRAHSPGGPYPRFRQCARWDFGFTCAFCLLHESDIIDTGVEGWGATSIEHHELKSEKTGRMNDYTNCLYACKLCNQSRSTHETEDEGGRQLLDPSTVAWGVRFRLVGFQLRPALDDDADARYTWDSYKLDDPRKVAIREKRFEEIRRTLERRSRLEETSRRLRETALAHPDGAIAGELIRCAGELSGHARDLVAGLRAAHAVVPADAAAECGCDASRAVPRWLLDQTQDI